MHYTLIHIALFMIICGNTKVYLKPLQSAKTFAKEPIAVNRATKAVSPIRFDNIKNEVESLLKGPSDFFLQRNLQDFKRVKRDVVEVDPDFIENLFKTKESEERQARGFNDFEDKSLQDDEKTTESAVEAVHSSLEQDVDFQNEKSKAANLTNSSKFLFDEIENNPATLLNGQNENIACCDSDNDQPKTKEFVSSTSGSSNLKMHLFHEPNTKNKAFYRNNKQPLLKGLYTKFSKSKKSAPMIDNYVTLLSQSNKLIEVPAVKYTVIPREIVDKGSKSNIQHFYSYF